MIDMPGVIARQLSSAVVAAWLVTCLSACAIAFLGGATGYATSPIATPARQMEIGARIGFHGFYLNPNTPGTRQSSDAGGLLEGIDQAKLVSSILVAYAVEVGIDPTLVARMLPKRQNEFVHVSTVQDLISLQKSS